MASTIVPRSDLFQNYLQSHQEDVKFKQTEGYYHVDVVADAYSKGFAQGFDDGKQEGKEDIISLLKTRYLDIFKKKANQVYILGTNIIEEVKKENFSPKAIFIDLFAVSPRILVSVETELLLNDNFNHLIYAEIQKAQNIYAQLFGNDFLDIGVVDSSNLDLACLKAEGFGYSEIYNSNEKARKSSKKKP